MSTSLIIKAAINVHKVLGPGLLESVYQLCMIIEINVMGMNVQSEVPVTIFYNGNKVHKEKNQIISEISVNSARDQKIISHGAHRDHGAKKFPSRSD